MNIRNIAAIFASAALLLGACSPGKLESVESDRDTIMKLVEAHDLDPENCVFQTRVNDGREFDSLDCEFDYVEIDLAESFVDAAHTRVYHRLYVVLKSARPFYETSDIYGDRYDLPFELLDTYGVPESFVLNCAENNIDDSTLTQVPGRSFRMMCLRSVRSTGSRVTIGVISEDRSVSGSAKSQK